MSLKDDIGTIEAFIISMKERIPRPWTSDAHAALYRIKATIALDYEPPREGDVVVLLDCPVMGENFLTQWEAHHKWRKAVLLMRAEEVARRIKEAGR